MAIERKCGICQKNKILNNIHAGASNVPVDATQPPTGGKAPGTEPIIVFNELICLLGV